MNEGHPSRMAGSRLLHRVGASPPPTSCSLSLLLVLIVGLLALQELLSAARGAHMLHANVDALGDDPVTNLQAVIERLSSAALPRPTT